MADEQTPTGTEDLLAYLEAEFGDRFEGNRRERLRGAIADHRENAEVLSACRLENDDEPAFAFRPFREESIHGTESEGE